MSNKLTIVLGGVTLPDQTQLIETTNVKEMDVTTLDNSLYTDFTNIRRSWTAALLPVCRDDFDAIYAVYLGQYENESYVTLVCDALGINTTVKVNISDQNLRWNGDQVEDFSLTLQEAYGIS